MLFVLLILLSLNKLQHEQMRGDDNPRITLIERLLREPRRLIAAFQSHPIDRIVRLVKEIRVH